MRVKMHQAKRNRSRLVALLERGEVEEVEIARAGHVDARLLRARPPADRTPGAWAGRVVIHDRFDELPDDVAAAFGGESA